MKNLEKEIAKVAGPVDMYIERAQELYENHHPIRDGNSYPY